MENKQPIFTIEDGHVKIKGIYIGLPIGESKQVLSEQGFSMDTSDSTIMVFTAEIEGLGTCSISIRGGNGKVGSIVVSTARQCTEEEALAVFEQVKADMPVEPGFDYNGYGTAPKPHEIDHFWDLNEGLLKIQWDGFNIHGSSFKNNEGLDHILFWLQGQIVKDEEYWRSEVD